MKTALEDSLHQSVSYGVDYWVGTLSSAIGHYLVGKIDEKQLRGYYRAFLRSPVCDEGLRPLLPDPPTGKIKR